MRQHISLIAAMTVSVAAIAQDLHTEITVDRTVQPELQGAMRPKGLVPSIQAPKTEVRQLKQAEYTEPGTIEPDISILPAAAWGDSIEAAQYRGYATVGYLPLYNTMITAGRRIVNTRRVGMDIWGQYDGNSYNGDLPYYKGALFTNHVATVGGNGTVHVGRQSLLSAVGSVTLESIRHPYYMTLEGNHFWRSYNQGALDAKGTLSWRSRIGSVVYDIDGTLTYFTLNQTMPKQLKTLPTPLKQASGRMGFGIGVAENGAKVPWIGLDADISVLRTTNFAVLGTAWYIPKYQTVNLGQASFRPYLRFDNDRLDGLVGVNIDAGFKYKGKLRFAPEAKVNWRPIKIVSMYGHVTGGEYINYMSDLFAQNPYMQPFEAYGRTHMPLIATGGINLGPYDGMALGVRGGYALGRDQLLPIIIMNRNGLTQSEYYTADVDSWFVGANIRLAYKSYFSIAFDIATGGSNHETASWYQWHDGAKTISSVDLNIYASRDLTIGAGYEVRYDRKAKSRVYPFNSTDTQIYEGVPNLGTIHNVKLSGDYRFSSQMSGFIRVYNLLNRKYQFESGVPAQGINGLLGLSFKF